ETAVYDRQLSAGRIRAHVEAATAPVDSVTSLEPSADTYVNGAARTANYGGDRQLAVRGDSPYESYLRFELPNAPEGTQLRDAALRIRVSGDDFAGSTDEILVRPVTGEWS